MNNSSVHRHFRDRREHTRHPVRLKVDYPNIESFCADYTRNISTGGTFLPTTKTVPTGTVFELSLHVPGLPKPLTVNAEVVWVNGSAEAERTGNEPGIGLRFLHASPAEEVRLARLVEELARRTLAE